MKKIVLIILGVIILALLVFTMVKIVPQFQYLDRNQQVFEQTIHELSLTKSDGSMTKIDYFMQKVFPPKIIYNYTGVSFTAGNGQTSFSLHIMNSPAGAKASLDDELKVFAMGKYASVKEVADDDRFDKHYILINEVEKETMDDSNNYGEVFLDGSTVISIYVSLDDNKDGPAFVKDMLDVYLKNKG